MFPKLAGKKNFDFLKEILFPVTRLFSPPAKAVTPSLPKRGGSPVGEFLDLSRFQG
jgi:hypothetical protein